MTHSVASAIPGADVKSAISPQTMQDLASGFDTGRLRHDDHEDVRAQLALEGKRRVDGLVFEKLFQRRLLAVSSERQDLVVTTGWHIGYDDDGIAAYWFRLQKDEADWNACDEAVAGRVLADGKSAGLPAPEVVQVRFDMQRNGFLGRMYGSGKSSAYNALSKILDTLPRKKAGGQPRSMDAPAGLCAPAVTKLAAMDVEDMAWLSVQRRFFNCVLGAALGADPADIYAFVLNSRAELRQVEFKPKYPSRTYALTIDRYPHVGTVDLMTKLGITPLLVLLVAPFWTKEGEPVLWLNTVSTHNRWRWLAAVLGGPGTYACEDSEGGAQGEPAPDGHTVTQTSDRDSGHRGLVRRQWAVSWERLRLLHEGLRLGQKGGATLAAILDYGHTDGLPVISGDDLASLKLPVTYRYST